MAVLREPRGKATVTRFKDPHHRIARLYASGLRHQDVILRTGYSYSRLTTLYVDPAFQELIATYRKLVNESFVETIDDYHTQVIGNMIRAERHVTVRMEEAEEAGETIPIRDALAISRDAADRFGFGKKQTTTNINIDFASRLEKAITRSGVTIELESPRVSERSPLSLGNQGTANTVGSHPIKVSLESNSRVASAPALTIRRRA